MIFDAKVEVTCDGQNCQESVLIEPEYTYPDYSGKGGSYDTSTEAIERKLRREGWLTEGGKQYCSEGCKPD